MSEERKVRILERSSRELRVEIEGEDHTLLAPLMSKLLENEDVDIATYHIRHKLMSNPVLYVKMKRGDALEAVISAATTLAVEYNEFLERYRRAAAIV
ncbi:MAG: DNA-directed RNA polymerase subunit L [Methanophagales archaeon]|nr:DNA-directed RNA polymerase subunit L [Methanophagales archaeon]MCW3139190.1 DNA-directed RNA polymerase subunit L [Methanophagales archaeon]MCW7069717.1 DNA-directed RNA polymerase subunit L [Methanophagales archaeon]